MIYLYQAFSTSACVCVCFVQEQLKETTQQRHPLLTEYGATSNFPEVDEVGCEVRAGGLQFSPQRKAQSGISTYISLLRTGDRKCTVIGVQYC